ncbi:MAG: M28 family peptidase, partial [Gemmatimonadales bacterium]
MHRSLFVAVVFTAVGCASRGASASQAEPASAAPAAQQSPAATDPDLTAADLRTRLFAYAHDSMFGRASGTEGNFRATEYLAAEMERLGLEPAGDANGYFQQVPAFSRRLASSTAISIEGQNFELGTDFVPLAPIQGLPVNAQGSFTGVPVVYAGRMGTLEMLPPDEAVGKLVVVGPALDPDGNPTFGIDGPSLIGYARAAGIALANLEYGPSGLVGFLLSPQTFIADGPPPPSSGPPVMFVSTSMVSTIFGKPINELETGDAGTVITGGFEFETARTEWPVRNVIAILRGSDPDRSGEYVALGAHSDHVGIARQVVSHDSLRSYLTVVRPNGAEDEAREPTESEAARIATMLDSLRSIRPSDRPDSISNGADDDGSGTVTLLEIAEAFASSDRRPARSLLF